MNSDNRNTITAIKPPFYRCIVPIDKQIIPEDEISVCQAMNWNTDCKRSWRTVEPSGQINLWDNPLPILIDTT
jgi:hypothetical protein